MKKLLDFLGEWAWLIIIIVVMMVFWGIVLHDIYSIFNFK